MFFQEENDMFKQVLSAPGLVKKYVDIMKEEVRFALTVEQTYQIKDLYMVGSGDSLILAKAACMAFDELAHVDAHAISSLEASRYLARGYMPSVTNHSLVIAISNSGETARVVEAVKWLKKRGAVMVALTSNKESTIGKLCDSVICTKIEKINSAPEIRSFEINLLALFALAIRMGENKGVYTMDMAGNYRTEIKRICDLTEGAITENAVKLKNMAKQIVECDEVEFIGSASSKGSAEFGVAKVIEATGTGAMAQEWEEFCHVNFFRRTPSKVPAVLVYPSLTPAKSRIKELLWLLDHIGRPYLVISDYCADTHDNWVSAGEAINEIFSPLYSCIMIAQMVSYMNCFIDEDYYRGHLGVWDESKWHVNRQSKIEECESET